jgi:hypothetical protein
VRCQAMLTNSSPSGSGTRPTSRGVRGPSTKVFCIIATSTKNADVGNLVPHHGGWKWLASSAGNAPVSLRVCLHVNVVSCVCIR